MLRWRFVARIDEAVVGLEPLQQVGDLDVRVPVVGVADLGPLAEQRVRLVEEQHQVAGRRAASKIRSRFFSVSPMYLLTTADRSTLYRSSPSSPATTSAASVLPVPDGAGEQRHHPGEGNEANPQSP